MKVVLAEKPSVGSSIAQVLGARERHDGYFQGNGYQVTWAVGHLVETASPEAMNSSWKAWTLEQLPLIPTQWPLETRKDVADQFKVVKKLLCARATTEVVCATDAGREGEHIFRLIYRLAGCRAPVRRLWISALTEDAIRKGFANLRPGSDFDGLAAAAEGRDKADWMVGLTLTRLYTLLERARAPQAARESATAANVWSVGRVQTPTLALVVARDLTRKQFARTPYRQVRARFGVAAAEVCGLYHREVKNSETGEVELSAELPSPATTRFLVPTEDADAVVERVRLAGAGRVRALQRKTQKTPPPLLYDLSALQQEANALWGWQATQTLSIAQRLYQEHKVLSYPRTGSRHLDTDTAASVPQIFQAVVGGYRTLLPAQAGSADLPKRFVDDQKVGDHHALIPTGRAPSASLNSDERALYDLVVRRFLQMWGSTCVEELVRVEVVVRGGHIEDLFVVRGTEVVQPGWSALELKRKPDEDDDALQGLPAGLREGVDMQLAAVEALNKSKSPPPAYTEASLLKAMETAGKRIEDPELAAAMRGLGLGTPATRAAILDSLVSRGYVERDGRALRATNKGIGMISRVHPEVRTPEITGRWEQRLERIARGQETLDAFLADVAAYVTDVVAKERARVGVP